jgi:pyruvate dehydrogenase E2 component (dihydrolipoamide acetyltransferase)
MATEIKLPRLGQGMESGTIVKWLKAEGEPVEKGEPLYELDTDKVTQEVEADASGVLLKIAVAEGEVDVGRTIAVIGEEGEEVSLDSSSNGASAEAAEEAPAKAEPAPTQGQSLARVQTRDGDRIKASPLARRIARERGIDLAQIQGTGPDGRIVAEDVERAEVAPAPAPAAPAPAAPPGQVEVRQLTSVRKTIARRLTQAWQAPVFQLTVSVDMRGAQSLVQQLRELHAEERPTVTDVLTRVTASALMRHRDVNAHYVDDEIRIHPSANVGIAVAAPQGLVVPVIRGAERLTIAEIARARAEVVQRARDNKLRQEDLQDGTFTISNLGMFGVEQFIAVLNPPQVAILAVGATEDRVVVREGQFAAQPTMTMTLTCDHRAIDGAVGAQFLQTLAQYVEQPALAL